MSWKKIILSWIKKNFVMENINFAMADVGHRKALCLCQPLFWSMATMLPDSVAAVVVVVITRPRAIPLAMITMRKSTHGFSFSFP